MSEQYYLVAYDIADEKRLVRVAKKMESYGVRVQKSIFEAALDPASKTKLQAALLELIDPEEDGVKFFPLCARCLQRITLVGEGEQPELMQSYAII